MNKANTRKEQQLGIPFGTANARLRKAILFRLAQTAKVDMCFRCNKPIQTVEEFSIDHRLPWQDVDTTLFWDLDNIGFSHLKCNISAARHATGLVHAETTTEAWCAACDGYRPIEEFAARNGVPGRTVQEVCKPCKNGNPKYKR